MWFKAFKFKIQPSLRPTSVIIKENNGLGWDVETEQIGFETQFHYILQKLNNLPCYGYDYTNAYKKASK